MKDEITDKLKSSLSKPITEESQVVYILSRIRKILEMDKDKNQSKYQKLKFYCDWALHAEIDRGTRIFKDEFEKLTQGEIEKAGPIFTHQFFETEFLAFLEQYGISAETYAVLDNKIAFRRLLAEILAETPLIVTISKQFKIVTNKGMFSKDGAMGKMEIGFRVDPMSE